MSFVAAMMHAIVQFSVLTGSRCIDYFATRQQWLQQQERRPQDEQVGGDPPALNLVADRCKHRAERSKYPVKSHFTIPKAEPNPTGRDLWALDPCQVPFMTSKIHSPTDLCRLQVAYIACYVRSVR